MVTKQLITTMTFYHFVIEIRYYSFDDGRHGFNYAVKNEDATEAASQPIFKTALDAGIGALRALKVMHGEED